MCLLESSYLKPIVLFCDSYPSNSDGDNNVVNADINIIQYLPDGTITGSDDTPATGDDILLIDDTLLAGSMSMATVGSMHYVDATDDIYASVDDNVYDPPSVDDVYVATGPGDDNYHHEPFAPADLAGDSTLYSTEPATTAPPLGGYATEPLTTVAPYEPKPAEPVIDDYTTDIKEHYGPTGLKNTRRVKDVTKLRKLNREDDEDDEEAAAGPGDKREDKQAAAGPGDTQEEELTAASSGEKHDDKQTDAGPGDKQDDKHTAAGPSDKQDDNQTAVGPGDKQDDNQTANALSDQKQSATGGPGDEISSTATEPEDQRHHKEPVLDDSPEYLDDYTELVEMSMPYESSMPILSDDDIFMALDDTIVGDGKFYSSSSGRLSNRLIESLLT